MKKIFKKIFSIPAFGRKSGGKLCPWEAGLLFRDCLPGDGTPSAFRFASAGSPWYQSLIRLRPLFQTGKDRIFFFDLEQSPFTLSELGRLPVERALVLSRQKVQIKIMKKIFKKTFFYLLTLALKQRGRLSLQVVFETLLPPKVSI